MSLAIAARIARRELRAGLSQFRIFMACLILGVAAIAAVGSVRASIEGGLSREGAALLGGDAEIELTYRFATAAERAWMDENALAVSELADFRSMVGTDSGTDRALTQVKAVDGIYPIYGAVVLDPPMPLHDALAGSGGRPGAVLDQAIVDRLQLAPGAQITIGGQPFVFTATLVREPDNSSAGFTLGPRSIVSLPALADSGLLAPGTLFETDYRLQLPPGVELDAAQAAAEAALGEGLRWRDARNGAPGTARFVERLGAFLVLTGLAGLAVGGIGVAAAVRAYLERKTKVIATLKTLGAERATIFQIYFIQIGVLTAIALVFGLALGALIPLGLAPLLAAQMPVPIETGIYVRPLAEAALYGSLTALIFTLWPLARAQSFRAAALYRNADFEMGGRPPLWVMAVIGGLAVALVGAAAVFTGVPKLAQGAAAGIVGALIILAIMARVLRILARRVSRLHGLRGRPALRLALASVGGPGGETTSVMLSLGLGLSVLAAVGQIDANLRSAIANDLPEVAPAYFALDIQSDQIDAFQTDIARLDGVSKIESAPMLRGIITQINGKPATEVAGDHWVVRGDRGVTYSDKKPAGTKLTAGKWWPADYSGAPQISFAAEEAQEIGLSLGDTMTINVLGRDITGTITSFREVDFSNAGMGFVLSMNPAALSGAPHSHIATIYAPKEAETRIARTLGKEFPNVTTIGVRDAIGQVSRLLGAIAAATSAGAAATLITGAVVLIGAAAAGETSRRFEAAVLRTVGATQASVLVSFWLRSALVGVLAGMVAIAAGTLAAWAVLRFVMSSDFHFQPGNALAVVAAGLVLTLATGAFSSFRSMSVRPARILRNVE